MVSAPSSSRRRRRRCRSRAAAPAAAAALRRAASPRAAPRPTVLHSAPLAARLGLRVQLGWGVRSAGRLRLSGFAAPACSAPGSPSSSLGAQPTTDSTSPRPSPRPQPARAVRRGSPRPALFGRVAPAFRHACLATEWQRPGPGLNNAGPGPGRSPAVCRANA